MRKDVEILKAMAHPVRLEMIKTLYLQGELCACDICGLFDCDRTTASKHLAQLKSAGVVDSYRDGKMIIYSLTMKCAGQFLQCIDTACCDINQQKGEIKDENDSNFGAGMCKLHETV